MTASCAASLNIFTNEPPQPTVPAEERAFGEPAAQSFFRAQKVAETLMFPRLSPGRPACRTHPETFLQKYA
jgi:hypothetical protein